MTLSQQRRRQIVTFIALLMAGLALFIALFWFIYDFFPTWTLVPMGVGIVLALVLAPTKGAGDSRESDP